LASRKRQKELFKRSHGPYLNQSFDFYFCQTGLYATDGATMQVTNSSIVNNIQSEPWNAIVASSGATISVGNSIVQGNEGLEFGALAQGVPNQGVGIINLDQTDFFSNVGFNDPEVSERLD